MCAYCESNKKEKDIVAQAKQEPNIVFGGIVDNQLFLAGKSAWDSVYSMTINIEYCPKCGRKLE